MGDYSRQYWNIFILNNVPDYLKDISMKKSSTANKYLLEGLEEACGIYYMMKNYHYN